MAISADDWLKVLEADYLADFIPSGGAAVKFAIAEPDRLGALRAALEGSAQAHRMIFAPIDAAAVKLHMMQDLFFSVSRRVHWTGLAQAFVERLLDEHAYDWPQPGEPASFSEVAQINDTAAHLLERDVKQWLTAEVWNDPTMNQDFRAAMIGLCLARFDPRAGDDHPILQWLMGDLARISVLKAEDIYANINRNNARSMFASLTRWLTKCGVAGMIVCIDLSQLSRRGAAAGEGVRYSKAGVMDAYEVLRQLIDDVDHHERLLVVAIGDPELTDGREDRVISQYQALQMRIWNEVRPSGRDNPAAPLVRLAG